MSRGVGRIPDGRTNDDWLTPAEAGDYRTTPDYSETLRYVERLAAARPDRIRIEEFGRTGEGRPLKLVVTSRDGVFDPSAVHASGRAVVLVQNSIHAGEMDGKDACLALLRDLTRDPTMEGLLANLVFAFIPVYNIDGHERRSTYTRINQKGPELSGWRANGTNLNLNRDYMKADAPETRAFLGMFHRWLPDFFVDDHVTDGADFQYDVTFRIDDTPDVAPATARWLRETVTPELARRVDAAGHLAFPDTIFLNDDSDPAKGLAFNENPPRFSTGQMILENRPGLLVELHMLKDYRTRVTGNYEILRALLEIVHREARTLIALNREADGAAARLGSDSAGRKPFPLVIAANGGTAPIDFRGVEFARELSEVSGTMRLRYGTRPWNVTLPGATGGKAEIVVSPPAGYIVPPQWTSVIDVLEAHGVTFHRTTTEWTGNVERYRCSGMQWSERPFEGRHPILRGGQVEREFGTFGRCDPVTEEVRFPARSAVFPLSQRLAKVILHWLEPEAPDSALRWGFFDPIFERKESAESYVLEQLASEELARDPALRAEFERRVQSDPGFAANPAARLELFFDRSPWGRENRVGVYPVGRLASLAGVPVD